MERVVRPEILDDLSADDPAARASRKDLRRINFLMGNERWILKQVSGVAATRGIVEWGAGSGELLRQLARRGPVVGIDRVARPMDLANGIGWRSENVFDAETSGGVLVANLFLHHFEADDLRRLGRRMAGYEQVVAVEPWRSRIALGLNGLMQPWVNPVTRHDMPVSIRAGFRKGELGGLLGLDPEHWDLCERIDPRGGLRWLARRRNLPDGVDPSRC